MMLFLFPKYTYISMAIEKTNNEQNEYFK